MKGKCACLPYTFFKGCMDVFCNISFGFEMAFTWALKIFITYNNTDVCS